MIDALSIRSTAIPEVLTVETKWYGDERGRFSETFNADRFADAGLPGGFIQDNHVVSSHPGTLRGMHFQLPPHHQAKLVRVLVGRMFVAAVDVRVGSPWYGRHVGLTLSADNRLQLFVPAGFAHGYCTLDPDTEVLYKVDRPYAPEAEGGIAWDDPDLAISWPVPAAQLVVAERDRRWPRLADLGAVFHHKGLGQWEPGA